MGRVFTARFPGTCGKCGEDIVAGDDVTYDDDVLVHEECASTESDEERAARQRQIELNRKRDADRVLAATAPTSVSSNLDRFVAKAKAAAPPPAPVTMTAAQFFATPAAAPDDVAAQFFSEPERPKYTTLEEKVEAEVKRDQWDRPLILQPDGGEKAYNRASSYGGQLDDKTNVEKWAKRQVVRGIAIALRAGRAPTFLDSIDPRLFDPWQDQESSDKKLLDGLVDRAQDMAGSNLKSQLGTDIHYATELVDLGESLEAGLKDFEPERRRHLAERADAYHRKTKDYGLKWDSVETFGVQDELEVAGTWDRRGFVPWWPEHQQVIGDVKTSSTMDFAGITYAVQLATYAHMSAYDIATGERTPHDDINPKKALIIHVERHMGGGVELYPVNIEWGWRHARLAREIIVARREGSKKGPQGIITRLDDREAAILSTTSPQELLDLRDDIMRWPQWLQKLAQQQWEKVA